MRSTTFSKRNRRSSLLSRPRYPRKVTEDSIVEMLRRRFSGKASGLEMGIGDDAAVIDPRRARGKWVVTTDMLVEDVDFRRNWQSPRQLGWKALAVNLSDLAAMGARPRFYTVSLALPRDIDKAWIGQLYEGLEAVGANEGAVLIGGDLSRSPSGVQISVTALGECARHKILYRSGGTPEDVVYVTGLLGQAAAGLALLEAGQRSGRSKSEREALAAFRAPRPRCLAGLWFAACGMVHAAMDLSDGLSMDLPRLCRASGTGAEITESQLPIFPDSTSWGCDPLRLGFHGGEDFELLLAVPADRASRLEKNYPAHFPPLRRIGRLTSRPGVITRIGPDGRRYRLPARGFDHFSG